MPRGDPLALVPQREKSFDEVCKGIDGFVNIWGTMANEDLSGEFRRINEPLSYYWRGVRSALDKPLPTGGPLKNGFWPSTRYEEELEDQFLDNGGNAIM